MNQDVITCRAGLSLFSATCSQQKLPEAGTTQSEKKAETEGRVLQQRVLSAKPHAICESEPRHLNKLVFDAETCRAVIADVSHAVNVSHTGTLVL